MDCIKNDHHGAEILTDYCAGNVDPAIASAIEEHIQHCAECKKLVDAQFAVWETLDAWTPVEVSSNFDARLYARIAAEQSGPAWLPRWWSSLLRPATPYSWWKPAASLAVAAAIVSLVVATRIPRPTPSAAPATVAAVPAATASASAPGAAPAVDAPAAASSPSEDIDLQQVQQALDDLEILAPASQSAASPL